MSNSDNRPLMVSIRCLVYNHEPYLRQCLEGFVMQKTNFRFEAIVHDDASTDKSADIIREYAEKYPDIIKPVYEKENVYSKSQIQLRQLMNSLCKGKYVATCEGDDFWTDPYKLQKQVDYMESHPDCSMCFTDANVIFEDGVPTYKNSFYPEIVTRDWYGTDIVDQKSVIVPTASVLYINDLNDYPNDPRFIAGDVLLILFMMKKGYIHSFGEKMVTYRRNYGGVSLRTKNIQKLIAHYEALKEYFGIQCLYLNRTIVIMQMKAFKLGKFKKESWKALFYILKSPRYTLLMFRILPDMIRSRNNNRNIKYVIK